MTNVTLAEAERIQKQFMGEYCQTPPWNEYINGVGISKIGIQDSNATENEKGGLCLYVMLRKPLPAGMNLPSKYQDIKVYSRVREMRAL